MFFAALVLAAATAAYTPRPVSPADKAKIMRKADELMFDGPATRWEWPMRRDAEVYCGKLNGKNQLGAYTGWRPFYYVRESFVIVTKDEDPTYEVLCGKTGYIPLADWLHDAGKPKP